jgi:cytoskeleton protein RodZ
MTITVGGQLRQARQQANVTLERIAARTKIRLRFLEAIDADDFDRLPDGVVRRGHLRAYAREVGLDPEQIVDCYLREQESHKPAAKVTLPSTDRLHLETRYTQVRPLLLAMETAYHRSVRALQRLLVRALQRTRLPQ